MKLAKLCLQTAILSLGSTALASLAHGQINCGQIDFDNATAGQVTGAGGLTMTVAYVSDEYRDCGVIFSSGGVAASVQTIIQQPGLNNFCVGTSVVGGQLIPDATQSITLTHEYLGQADSTNAVQMDVTTTGGFASLRAFDVNGAPVGSTVGAGTLLLNTVNTVIHSVVVIPPATGTLQIDNVAFGSCPAFIGINGCVGSGLDVRLTRNATCAQAAGSLDLYLESGVPFSTALIYFSPSLSAPEPAKCLSPTQLGDLLLLSGPLFGPFSVPFDAAGQAQISFPAVGAAGTTLWAQALITDPGVSVGLATTNVVQIN